MVACLLGSLTIIKLNFSASPAPMIAAPSLSYNPHFLPGHPSPFIQSKPRKNPRDSSLLPYDLNRKKEEERNPPTNIKIESSVTERQKEKKAEERYLILLKMSCNGCRVLRKGCNESCILRPCLQWIDGAEAQGYATVFVAKFFGRAGLMSFISSVHESQRAALFQSLLFEACGRTVNPVNGAVGLLWTGNWQICQAAVDTVLRGGSLRPIPSLVARNESGSPPPTSEAASGVFNEMWRLQREDRNPTRHHHCRFSSSRSKASPGNRKPSSPDHDVSDLDLRLNPCLTAGTRRPVSPSMNSEESVTTSCRDGGSGDAYSRGGGDVKLLNLFV